MKIKTRDLIEKKECGKPPSNPCTDRSRPVCRLTVFYQTPNTQIPNTPLKIQKTLSKTSNTGYNLPNTSPLYCFLASCANGAI